MDTSARYLDLHDAINLVGRKKFPDTWTDNEVVLLQAAHQCQLSGKRHTMPNDVKARLKDVWRWFRNAIDDEDLTAYYLGIYGDADWRPFNPIWARSDNFRMDLASKLVSGPEGALFAELCFNRTSFLTYLKSTKSRAKKGPPDKYDWEAIHKEAVNYCCVHGRPRAKAPLINHLTDWYSANQTADADTPSPRSMGDHVKTWWSALLSQAA